MALQAAIIAFTLISATSKIVKGIQENKAAKAEALLIEEQGALQQQEAVTEAQRQATESRKFRKKQKVAFLKNGITLAGSPLLVIEETRRESQEEVNATVRRGNAQASLAFQQAAMTRNSGRAALLGGIFGAAGTVVAGAAVFGASGGFASAGKAGATGSGGVQSTTSFGGGSGVRTT